MILKRNAKYMYKRLKAMLEMKPIWSLMGYINCNSSSEIQSKLMLLGPKGERMKDFVNGTCLKVKKTAPCTVKIILPC